jgi:hypothetical protein
MHGDDFLKSRRDVEALVLVLNLYDKNPRAEHHGVPRSIGRDHAVKRGWMVQDGDDTVMLTTKAHQVVATLRRKRRS